MSELTGTIIKKLGTAYKIRLDNGKLIWCSTENVVSKNRERIRINYNILRS